MFVIGTINPMIKLKQFGLIRNLICVAIKWPHN